MYMVHLEVKFEIDWGGILEVLSPLLPTEGGELILKLIF